MKLFMREPYEKVENPSPNHYVPVARYATGMSGGLYFGDTQGTQYCGTFYYLEPDSNVFLYFKSALRVKDKIAAAEMLDVDINMEDLHVVEPDDDLYMTPQDFFDKYPEKVIGIDYDPNETYNLEELFPNLQYDRKYYVAHILNYYADQDSLDQAICEAAKTEGYDVIILEKMVGSRQIVSEVLDVRDRMESFDNLVIGVKID